MKYKLLALDLDDTLMYADKSIPEINLKAAADAKAAGIHVVVATGRAMQSAESYIKLLNTGDCSIVLAGGETYGPDGKLLRAEYLPSEEALKVMEWAHERGVHYQAYIKDIGLAFAERGHYARFYEDTCKITGKIIPDLKNMAGILTPKILMAGDPDFMKKLRPELAAAFPHLKVTGSQPEYVEVLNPFTSKGNALKALADSYGIKREEVMAIGDSDIDADMLEYAGLGVCMANGTDYTKASADYITGRSEEDGAADAIYKFALAN